MLNVAVTKDEATPSNKKKAALETARRRKPAMQATRGKGGKATSFTKGITNQNGLIFGTTKCRKHPLSSLRITFLFYPTDKISKAPVRLRIGRGKKMGTVSAALSAAQPFLSQGLGGVWLI